MPCCQRLSRAHIHIAHTLVACSTARVRTLTRPRAHTCPTPEPGERRRSSERGEEAQRSSESGEERRGVGGGGFVVVVVHGQLEGERGPLPRRGLVPQLLLALGYHQPVANVEPGRDALGELEVGERLVVRPVTARDKGDMVRLKAKGLKAMGL